jgi:hypothetical protein
VYLLLNREEKGRAEELNLNLYQIKFKLEWEEIAFTYTKVKFSG